MAIHLTEILTAAKENADKVDDDHIGDPEWTRHTRNAIEELHQFVANAYKDTFFQTADFTLSGNSYYLDLTLLSPKFRRCKGVDVDPDKSTRRALKPFNFQERAYFAGLLLPWWGAGLITWCNFLRYRVLGSKLYIQPQESAAGSYRIYYSYAPTLPTSESDTGWTLDPQLERWVEYIEVAAGRRGLWKEETDTRATLDQRLAQMRADIMQDASQDEMPSTTVDVGW
jgi:hypothetical protein